MSWPTVVSLAFGSALLAAVLTTLFEWWQRDQQRKADLAAEKRLETRDKRVAQRIRLAPLYAAAIRSASDFAESEHRKTYRLQGDDSAKLKERLAELTKAAQGRLDEVGVPLELETGTEEFNKRYDEFRKRYIRKLTAIVQPFPGLTQVDAQDMKIDLWEDVTALKAIAKRQLHELEADLL